MSYPPGFCTPGLSVRQCEPNELAEEASAEPGAALLFQLSPESGEGEEGRLEPASEGLGRSGPGGDLDSTVRSGWSADQQLTSYLKRFLR